MPTKREHEAALRAANKAADEYDKKPTKRNENKLGVAIGNLGEIEGQICEGAKADVVRRQEKLYR